MKGKTKRSHPRGPIPRTDGLDWLITHTESHWQTPSSFIEYIDGIIVPYKNRRIVELALPHDQMTLLKLDLHYSHKDPRVIAHMKAQNIVPVFVPAGQTDKFQECDLVVNKPFKAGAGAAFRVFLNDQFTRWRESDDENRPQFWTPDLSMKSLKPKILDFVQCGVSNLNTPDMKQAIVNAFKRDGLFERARSSGEVDRVRLIVASRAAAARAEVVPPAAFEVNEEEEGVRQYLEALEIDTVYMGSSESDDDDVNDNHGMAMSSSSSSSRANIGKGMSLVLSR